MKTIQEIFEEYKRDLIKRRNRKIDILEDTSFQDFENSLNLKDNDEEKIYHAYQSHSHEDGAKYNYFLIQVQNYFIDKLSEINMG